MSLARKIAWWSLLAMVFVVPVAMSNATWLSRIGFPVTLPFTYDQFDIMKVFFQRVLTLVALGAWSWDMLTKGGKIRRTPVDWLILAFLAWVTHHHHHVDPPADRVLRQVPPLRGPALVHQLRGDLLPGPAVRRPALARQGARPVALLVEHRGRRLRRAAARRPRPGPVGPAALRAVPSVLDVRQPRPARRLPHVLAAGRARTGARRGEDVDAARVLGRLRHERVRVHRGVHARRVDRRRLRHRGR